MINFFFFRVKDDLEEPNLSRSMENDVMRNYNFDGIKMSKSTSRETGRFFKAKVLRKIFSEDFEKEKNKILVIPSPKGLKKKRVFV